MRRFTSEFGMGSGGSNALCSSGKPVWPKPNGVAFSHTLYRVQLKTADRVGSGDAARVECFAVHARIGTDLVFFGAVVANSLVCLLIVLATRILAQLSLSMTALGYMVKPHGQLVLVSFTHYCASTPSLSTWWSSTALQGHQVPREISS